MATTTARCGCTSTCWRAPTCRPARPSARATRWHRIFSRRACSTAPKRRCCGSKTPRCRPMPDWPAWPSTSAPATGTRRAQWPNCSKTPVAAVFSCGWRITAASKPLPCASSSTPPRLWSCWSNWCSASQNRRGLGCSWPICATACSRPKGLGMPCSAWCSTHRRTCRWWRTIWRCGASAWGAPKPCGPCCSSGASSTRPRSTSRKPWPA